MHGVGVACEVLSDNMLIEKHLGDLGSFLRSPMRKMMLRGEHIEAW